MPHVLVVEDDPRIRGLLLRSLEDGGFAASSAGTGMSGLAAALDTRPDLVVLDLGLPDVDGTTVLDMLRAVSAVPVIIASARDDDPSLVKALDAGADDYLVKPYTSAQLIARVRAVLRRSGGATERRVLTVGGLVLDLAARTATLDSTPLDLSPKEFDLLTHLAERVDEVVTKKELLTEVWNLPYGGSDKTVDVHLSWLRRKLGESAATPAYLHTVRGVGVRMSSPAAD